MIPFKGNKEVLDLVGNAATVGLHLVCATFIGMAFGWYLDEKLGTKPWLLLVFLCIGIAAGFKNVYEEAKRIQRSQGNDTRDNNDDENEPED